MENFINYLEISNFKSVRHLKLTGFKRINLFLGRPNVGKSNLLEAMSLFSLPYLWEGSKKLTDLVRIDSPFELFFDGNYDQTCVINVELNEVNKKSLIYEINLGTEGNILKFETFIAEFNQARRWQTRFDLDSELKMSNPTADEHYEIVDHIKRYRFTTSGRVQIRLTRPPWITFLRPPFGDNLVQVLTHSHTLNEYFGRWFNQYGLRLVLDRASQSLKVMKDKGDTVFILPYSSVADTLQRIIFYKTAVASNENSVLLFEEPEAHAYPPYISEFTQEVIRSTTNQFFIVTHSPLIVE